MSLLSVGHVAEAFVHATRIPGGDLGSRRAIQLPGLLTTVGDMVTALRRVAGPGVAERITFRPDPAIERIVAGWPVRFAARRAAALGFRGDEDVPTIIEEFIRDELDGTFVR